MIKPSKKAIKLKEELDKDTLVLKKIIYLDENGDPIMVSQLLPMIIIPVIK